MVFDDGGLVSGDAMGEYSNGALGLSSGVPGVSKKLEREELRGMSSMGAVAGQHVEHCMGLACVQRMLVGPWVSQKWASEI